MLERYLVISEVDRGVYHSDNRVETLEHERDVKDLVGRLAAGNYGVMEDPVKLKRIYKVDLTYGKIVELEPALENMKLVLKEKKKNE